MNCVWENTSVLPSSNFVEFIHCDSRICLGQNVKALVSRWKQYLHSQRTDINKRGMYLQVSYRGMFRKSFRIDSRYIIVARVDEIRILFLGHPV